MTPAQALAPAITAAREEVETLRRDLANPNAGIDVAAQLRAAAERLELLEAMARATVSETTTGTRSLIDGISHFVIRSIDGGPPEVYPFAGLADAEAFYDRAAWQWSDVYITSVLRGPMQ